MEGCFAAHQMRVPLMKGAEPKAGLGILLTVVVNKNAYAEASHDNDGPDPLTQLDELLVFSVRILLPVPTSAL